MIVSSEQRSVHPTIVYTHQYTVQRCILLLIFSQGTVDKSDIYQS